MIGIPSSLRQRIRTHAENEYPHECCGALLGRFGDGTRDVVDIEPVDNRRTGDEARRRFFISADDYRAIDARARQRNLDIVGFYHSHPDHPAVPSEFDREHALPWLSYVIVSVQDGESRSMASYLLSEDRTRFEADTLT